jgi:hypothetical protein
MSVRVLADLSVEQRLKSLKESVRETNHWHLPIMVVLIGQLDQTNALPSKVLEGGFRSSQDFQKRGAIITSQPCSQ